ncbi:MAG: branched-chain amino acid ABC transporter permease [Anaerolineales bacterium]
MRRIPLHWLLVGVAAVIVLAAPALLASSPYLIHVAIVAYFYAVLASSWSLLAGYAGQFSFAHMAFMSIAAYTTGIMGRDLGTSPFVGIVAGTLLAGFVGLIIGILCLRLRSTYLALFTIAFAEILRLAINAELEFTGGPNGLHIQLMLDTLSRVPYYYIMLGLLAASLGIMYWIANSRFGLFFRAIREDEEAAAALGVHVVLYKVMVFVITSLIAGLAGAVFAHYIEFITPNIMLIAEMSIVIAMAVIGGVESLIGAAIGAVFVHFSLEMLREIALPASWMPQLLALKPTLERLGLGVGAHGIATHAWRRVFFGLLLMLTLRFWRNGLIYPVIQRLFRRQMLAETVAKRQLPAEGEAG